ncbi:MAG: hypothetical protein AAF423_07535 [Pseudomonadota bacterium]
MAKSPDKFAAFCRGFNAHGLVVHGALEIGTEHSPQGEERFLGSLALLIGNRGENMWQSLSASPEFCDGAPDPMNRWTRRIIDDLIVDLDCKAFYPFDKPYWPFQRIAKTATGMKSSPLGILIHPEFGLWQAMRGILIFNRSHEFACFIRKMIDDPTTLIHPCDVCDRKPCLDACPVGAFTGTSLEVERCFSHLDSGLPPDCLQIGCRARDACPVGVLHRYTSEQIQFHMKSYRGF